MGSQALRLLTMRYVTGLGLILLGCLLGILDWGLVLEVCGGLVSVLGVMYFLSEVVESVNRV